MSTFEDDLIRAMTEALAHAKGEGPAVIHSPVPRGKGEESPKNSANG